MTNKEKFLALVSKITKSSWLEKARFRRDNKSQLDINFTFAVSLRKYFKALDRYGYTIKDIVNNTEWTGEQIDSIRKGKLHELDNNKFLGDIKSILTKLFLSALNKRLSELSNIKNNWYEGYGKSVSKELISKFKDSILNNYDVSLLFPYIFPTVEGNIQLEWENKSKSIAYILEIDSDLKGEWLDISDTNQID